MLQDDFIERMLDVVSSQVKLTKPMREKIDKELRHEWGGAPVYIGKNSPSRRQAIKDATGTYEEMAKLFSVSVRTIYRVRKGR